MGRLAAADVGRTLMSAMSDPAHKLDAIDEANARFWRPRTLEELMAGKKPIKSWDDLDIPDLTDEEREAFAKALDESR